MFLMLKIETILQQNSLILIIDPIDSIRPSGHHECMPIGRPGRKASVQVAYPSLPAHVHI